MTDKLPSSWTLTARWVFPVEGPPLEQGVLTIGGERLLAVEPHNRRRADCDLGNAAILPGLVNAHTHLDLTGLRGRVPPMADFISWLRAIVRYRREVPASQIEADIRRGLEESLACGTTLLGDISGQGLSWPILSAAPIRSVVFWEMLGLSRQRARRAWVDARSWLQAHPPTPTCRPGLSPHAPYSVRRSLLQVAAALARRCDVPLATHLAETRQEMELLQHRQGPFVDFLHELGVWDEQGLVQRADQVLRMCAGVATFLLIHGNYLDAAAPLPAGSTVVYCPRTHAAFGHGPHPFRALLARGVRVALGSDSLASNPDLDILAEARFLHRCYPDVPGAVLLRMATLAGAEAMNWHHETGSLRPGKSADLVVLPLPSESASDPHRLVLESCLAVRDVLCRGQWLQGPASSGQGQR